ncbi:MAG: hypothetical protein R3C40_11515 [Parvularculaceae bacterium]
MTNEFSELTSADERPPGAAFAPDGVAPVRWARLEAFLSTLTPAAASRLFAAIETARASGEKNLPTTALLNMLRIRLFDEGARFPARAPTAQRLFFTPFEDFFVARRRGRKRKGRIARASLSPVWNVLTTDPACMAAARAARELDAAIADAREDRDEKEAALFIAAAESFARLIAHADADTAYRADLTERLGGAGAMLDMAEINLLLPVVEQLKAVQAAFVRPVYSFTEEDLFEARRLYARTQAQSRDGAPYTLLCLAGRMDAPWRAMPVYYHIAAARDERLPEAREDARELLETLFEDIESAARALERDAEDAFEPADAAIRLEHFAAFAAGMIDEARRERDGVTINRVEACRDIAAAALERFCEQSLAAVRKALPVRHAGGSSRLMALRPDIERGLDDGVQAMASGAAQFLSSADALAGRLARADVSEAITADAVAEVRRYANDLVVEIRSAEGAERRAARQRMEATLRLAAPLLAPLEVSVLKERAAAASVSA